MSGLIMIGEKWDVPDAIYQKKNIGKTMMVELIGGKCRGGYVKIWIKPDQWWIDHYERFPKSSQLTEDKEWMLLDAIHFMYWENASNEYAFIKTQKDGTDLAWRNR